MSSLNIPVIDCAKEDARELFAGLREKLSPRGDVVSESGRQRTVELFGAALSPQQVVERICSDVSRDGLNAVMEYTRKLDGKELTLETMPVSEKELEEAHANADAGLLEAVRRIRENIIEFQRAVLAGDASIVRKEGRPSSSCGSGICR